MLTHLFLVVVIAATPQAQPPKTVTFPNMVTTTELTAPPDAELSELEALLKAEGIEIDAEDLEGFQTQSLLNGNGPLHIAQFVTNWPRRPKNYQVKVPANGAFKLTLQAGPRFEVIDNDASDGSTTIQLPAGTLRTWMHLDAKWKQNSSLRVEDTLYYVNDTLSSAKKKWLDRNRWLKLGNRPLPVPSDWYSPDGNSFVLQMTAANASGFEMVWLKRKK